MLIDNNIDGELFEKLLTSAAKNLQNHQKEINDLNVFPVPDGDTGTNMYATLAGGIEYLHNETNINIEKKSAALAEGMLLNARGNSGVILSQLFYGIAQGLVGINIASTNDFSRALKVGVGYAYKAVVTPVEGTILTVAREAADNVCAYTNENTTLEALFAKYLNELKTSLKNTPELLAILKESNVVDSGGAGLVYIAEGFYKAITGESIDSEVASTIDFTNNENVNISFDRSSKMDYGYCTEILLQLLDSKNGVELFNLEQVKNILSTIGDSIVAILTGTKVKIHIHTMTPATVLNLCQKYGEFISIKIENMTLQHNNVLLNEVNNKKKKCAIVVVASGEGFSSLYKEYGADYIVSGGQTDNPSTEEFIKAFKEVNAESIIVLPNNKNILMAAKQAADLYKDCAVTVLPTKTPQQVYSALVVATDKNNVTNLLEDMQQAVEGVESYSITYSIRDAIINKLTIKKGDYMAFHESDLSAVDSDIITCFEMMLKNISDIEDKEIITLFYGNAFSQTDKENICDLINELAPDAEIVEYNGGQDIYPLLVAIE